MSNTSEVFNAFIEASKALDELPKVREERDEANELAKSYADDLTREVERTNQLQAILASVRAELASKEAELAQATKSNRDLSAVVDLVRGALPALPVAPSPAAGPGDMSSGAVSEASTVQNQGGQREADPITNTSELKNTSDGHTTNLSGSGTSQDQGSSEVDPTSAAEPASSTQPVHAGDANAPASASTSPHTSGPTESSPTPNPNPTSQPATQPSASHSSEADLPKHYAEGRDPVGESFGTKSPDNTSQASVATPSDRFPWDRRIGPASDF